ncbi:nuclear transport factor 2 family protein [Hyphococcus flavus]|uniref:Nuclear transport factor 2 family protein n=1 Tax=Hyphococcus flavus TaxID=1866326 RepID=A0AAF0CBF2_9PROT|nr:nuclear transport factor 2 family protein [Hyphococcus flavus]WDI30805.1 nuclear transport factor 2 family protein [Hyphococcus flavus]
MINPPQDEVEVVVMHTETLTRWHEMVAARDLSKVGEITREDVVFRSPVAHTPYHGRDALSLALNTVLNVFEGFTYHREFATNDGKDVVLEFSAHVGGKQLKGADFIKFDDDGMIAEFEVMIRPASGLMALGQAMGERIGGELPKYKAT